MFKFFRKKDNLKSKNVNTLDFSEIDSNEKALELFDKNELIKVHLMPLEFGGQDNSDNFLLVPEFVMIFKQKFDEMIGELLANGKGLKYSVEPEYKGNSFIPSKLKIKVTGDSKFSETINIW